jgi:exodeoxyribonuclease VII large subunit
MILNKEIENISNATEIGISVSEFSVILQKHISKNFSNVTIRGEISGLKIATSGHVYFSLKDNSTVLSAICWRSKYASLQLKLEEGMEITCNGDITTFPGQSKYQIIVNKVFIGGIGNLMALLEKKKKMLLAEGLFDEKHKKKIPEISENIAIITSATGAVIQDMLHRFKERLSIKIDLYPVLVQGEKCAEQVISAINQIESNQQAKKYDLIIIARGGGSIEDLWGFNDENLVRKVFACNIPVISAIGHETDYSLLDLVADKRAPTPTAAAEFAVPDKIILGRDIRQKFNLISNYFDNKIFSLKDKINDLNKRIIEPTALINNFTYRLEKIEQYISNHLLNYLDKSKHKVDNLSSKLNLNLIIKDIDNKQEKLTYISKNIFKNVVRYFELQTSKLDNLNQYVKYNDVNSMLKKGYSIIKDEKNAVLNTVNQITSHKKLHIITSDGECHIEPAKIQHNPK